jgi:hypothetical protein
MTIRDIDCKDFDVDAYIKGLDDMGVTFFSFFAGGYITTYPTKLKYQRVSPYLGNFDLTKALVETAHKYNIKALAMIDLGQLPKHAGQDNPEWCAKDTRGNPVMIEERLYQTCPNSGFRKEYAIEMVKEIMNNYDIDCVKFGGGSYGFLQEICYCEKCRQEYRQYSGKELPLERDWDDLEFREFYRWQIEKTAETVKYLVDMVKSINPEMPVMGNSVCFGDPKWTINSALDMEVLAKYQDAVQVEVQTRVHANEYTQDWQSMTWPAETANFMTHATDKPVWVVASYFLGWPWRRSAMPYGEQKVYYAQMIANGAIPMVNLSGGPMAVHEDKRGFRAIGEIYHFLKDNIDYYQDDKSKARIAIVFSQNTLCFYGQDKAMSRYVNCIRGFEQALDEEHIPYDLISLRAFDTKILEKYETIILPNTASMSQDEADMIKEYVKNGGSVISSFETSLYDELGNKRKDYLLGEMFGASYLSTRKVDLLPTGDYSHAYMKISANNHQLFEGIGETTLLPAAGYFCDTAEISEKYEAVLTLSAPYQVFPEGFAYPLSPDKNETMLSVNKYGSGKSIYFSGTIGKNYWQIHYPDMKRLIVNSINYCRKDIPILKISGPNTLLANVREQPGRTLVHLINLTGGKRLYEELIPLYDIEVGLAKEGRKIKQVYTLSEKKKMICKKDDKYCSVSFEKLIDYDVVVFEWDD